MTVFCALGQDVTLAYRFGKDPVPALTSLGFDVIFEYSDDPFGDYIELIKSYDNLNKFVIVAQNNELGISSVHVFYRGFSQRFWVPYAYFVIEEYHNKIGKGIEIGDGVIKFIFEGTTQYKVVSNTLCVSSI